MSDVEQALHRCQWARRAAWISGIAAAFSLYLARFGFGTEVNTRNPYYCWKLAQAFVLCGWIVLPPVWFWFEYFFIWRKQSSSLRETFDEFKHGQDQAAKIWLGLITVLLGLYFGKDILPHHGG